MNSLNHRLGRFSVWCLALLLLSSCRSTPVARPVVEQQPNTSNAPATSAAEQQTESTVGNSSSPDEAGFETDLDELIPLDSKVRKGRLDNGLTYYIRENQKPLQRAELRLVVNAGSLQEDDDQLGLAHLIEHMAFNGTRNFEKQELVDYLQSIGMRFGADLNAYTSFDETVYMLKVPTDDPEVLDQAFLILADWASGITFDPAEVDKERGVVIEEWRLGLGAGSRLRDKQFPVIFSGSRYSERLPIGTPEILESAPAATLERYYRDWYRPDLMAVVAVGDFETEAIEKLIEEKFQSLVGPEDPRPRTSYSVPAHAEPLFALATDQELTRTSASIYYKHPKADEGSYRAYRRSLVGLLHDSMLNARLGEIAQQADPPFLYAGASAGALVRTADVYSQLAMVRDGEVVRGLSALLEEVERVDRHGFTATELERAKKEVLRSYEQAYRERDKLNSAGFAAEFGRNFLEGEPIPGIELENQMVVRFLPTIELDEVNRQARDWITDENRVVVVSAPEDATKPLPSEEQLLEVFASTAARSLEPYVDQVNDQPLLSEVPEGGQIISRRSIPELGVSEWHLSNGVRVVLKPTNFKNDEISLVGSSFGGHSLVSDQNHTSALFASTIIADSGLGEFSSIELSKKLAGRVAGASTSIDELTESVSGFASLQDFETMLQLVYLNFTAPRLDLESYESLSHVLRNSVSNRDKRPTTLFQDRWSEILNGGHQRRRPVTESLLEEIDPHVALEIYKDRFADASDFTFVLVGSFDLEQAEPLVTRYLGGLPNTGRQEMWRDIGISPPTEAIKFEIAKGIEHKSDISLYFHGDATWSREQMHLLRSLAQALDFRLREILREELSATYGVRVSGNLNLRPQERYSVSISLGCQPERVEELIEEVLVEIEKVKDQGVSQEIVDKIREAQLRRRETDLLENSYWLRALQSYYSLDIDPKLILEYDQLVELVTSENLQQAAERYLDSQRLITGILDPATSPQSGSGP